MSSGYGMIAIVDDDEDITNLFIEVLQENSHRALGFTNPHILINYLHEHPNQIGLILLDYRMPHITGCQLSNQIYTIDPNIQMVLVSAFDEITNNTLNLQIVKKPMPLSRLLEVVDHFMNPIN